uniref:uncharacterized protein LOC122609239 n=1 Tax=Erigeron canadensis TaxID=72917 RepID=UPI001CB9CED0|nr:uncharacterized protein LOC122609239 [Erigeron canadensis]
MYNKKGSRQSLEQSNLSSTSTNTAYTGQQSHRQVLRAPEYMDIRDCTYVCEFCGALFWFDERVMSVPLGQRPRYTTCCKHGAVIIDFPVDPPDTLRRLFQETHFMNNIRAYNSMFSMTSFGAKVDDSVNQGTGPYVFKITGQISHWLGSICPPPGERRFLQMYIFDSESEVANRLSCFSNTSRQPLHPDVVSTLASTLNLSNEYVRLFKSAKDYCSMPDILDFVIRLRDCHRLKNYGLPEAGTLGAIVCDDGSASEEFDIVVRTKDDTPQRVSKLHPAYMPLQYPLLFLHGERGWSPALRLAATSDSSNRTLTMNMFYKFQIHERSERYTHLLHAGRLFQQYLVDCYVSIEHNRLEYIRYNQNDLRSEFLEGLYDALSAGEVEGRHVRKRVILPASFTGGPRYMYQHYQDALAICRVHNNPQYFITFTCNVKWPEIARELLKTGAQPQYRPDIIVRVFQLKVESFIKYIKDSQLFGAVTAGSYALNHFIFLYYCRCTIISPLLKLKLFCAEVYTIEFQKRGLPHCHILLWVSSDHTIQEATSLDNYISAELPDKVADPILYRIVTESMLHGPCGLAKLNVGCMFEGRCSKCFPKPYEDVTRFDSYGYVHYKRRHTDEHFMKGGVPLDNGFVVPYNSDLCRHFDAHINVEYCGWSMLIKYLFKYISKGVDRIKFQVSKQTASKSSENSEQSSTVVNEIDNFVDGRFICPHEAAWRILNFPIHHRNPAVQILAVHLERKQNVTFRALQKLSTVVSNRAITRTTLTEWLANNRRELACNTPAEQSGLHLKYTEYPSEYTWHANSKSWIRRARRRPSAVSKLVYVHPTCGELFYLRLLLTHQVGCTSFEDIRTVSGVTYTTYRLACEKLGLIGDDQEWSQTLSEASHWATSSELRSLFIHMLVFCEISNPLALWAAHWQKMGDDITYQLSHIPSSSASTSTSSDIHEYILYELEVLLKSRPQPQSLSDFGLPLPNESILAVLTNRLLLEEKTYDRDALTIEHTTLYSALNSKQLHIYNHVLANLDGSLQVLLFIYGHGGTGKTFLWRTIISALRSRRKVVLAVAASGIAALLLPGGRTAHSRFKIPLDLTEQSTCHIKKTLNFQSFYLKLI